MEDESSSFSPKPHQLLSSPAPETPNPPLESLREEIPPKSPKSLSLDSASPQRDALLRAPILNLTLSPLPRVPDRQEQEEEKAGESSDVEEEEKSKDWADQEEEKSSDIEEEVKSKEEPLRSQDWAPQEGEFSTVEEVKRERRKVVATRKWQELEPRTARTVRALKPLDKTDLSFEPGALITGIRPASWVKDDRVNCSRWLEGTLEGRVGLVLECWVEYLPAQSDSD